MCTFDCVGQVRHKDLASKHQLSYRCHLPRHSQRPVVITLFTALSLERVTFCFSCMAAGKVNWFDNFRNCSQKNCRLHIGTFCHSGP